LLGGFLVQALGWRWVFATNVPIVTLAGVIAARRIQPDRNQLGERVDLAGTALAALTLATLTFTVIEAGRGGFSSAVVVGLVLAVLAGLGFVAAELWATAPMLPLGLFRRPAFSTANGVAAVMNFGTLGLLFLLTLYLQSIRQHTAFLAGVAVLPLFLPLTVLAPIAGRVVGRHGPRPVMVLGLLVAAAGVTLLATCTADSSYLSLLPALLGWGIGLGLLTPAVVAAAIAATPHHPIAQAWHLGSTTPLAKRVGPWGSRFTARSPANQPTPADSRRPAPDRDHHRCPIRGPARWSAYS
jgi:MFS transporter, DHA2 family, methylenomycin A resistance protein